MKKDLRLIYAEAANQFRTAYMKKNPAADSDVYALAFSDGWSAAIVAGMMDPVENEPEKNTVVETFIQQEKEALLQFAVAVKQMGVAGTTSEKLGVFAVNWLKNNYPSITGGGIS
jgi:predicted naringenin-chalcone synthase